MALTKEQILKSSDLKTSEVKVPEWGGSVFIRTMTGKERDALEAGWLDANEKEMRVNARARILALTICDENGVRLFEESDIEALGQKSANCLERCYAVAAKLNRLRKQDIEELAGNSGGAQSGASTSA